MPHKTFSLEEVADYLHVSEDNISQLVRSGEIPFEKMGERIIFRRQDVDAWASQRILGLEPSRLEDYHKGSSAKHHDLSERHAILPELIKPGFIDPSLESRTKASLLRDMVELADATGLLNYKDDLLQSLEEREQMCSTALGGGVALLHPRHHDPYMFEDSFVVLGRAIQPLPFGSPDGRTTDVFFLACCQDDRIHLHVLARLCMIFYQSSVLYDIRASEDAGGMLETLFQAESEVIASM